MPRKRQPPRLWLRPASGKRASVWVILDGGRQIGTGCGKNDDAGAARALGDYIAKQHLKAPRRKERAADEIPIAEVMAYYLAARDGTIKRPKELAARIDALLDWWGDKTLDDISSVTCKAYWQSRSSRSLARRELEDLRAAINLAIADKLCRHIVRVTLPGKSRSRPNHLDRGAVARLLWAAYSKREVQQGSPTKKRPTLHVARFILAALYTGSRSGRIWQASFTQEEGRPWVDLDAGLFYRAASGEQVAKNKRAPTIRIPPRLLAHMRRWRAMGAEYVCEYQGRPADPKRAFRNLVDATLGEDAAEVVRHTLRHTAATWLMQAGVDKYEVSGYLGMTLETIETVYGHHHPDHQQGVADAFSTGRAGRRNAKR